MGLPWVRLDANIAMHDKILDLIDDPSPKRWQAVASYMFAIAWCGGAGNDGRIRNSNLVAVHGNQATARLLVKYRLWDEAAGGYQIVNYGTRQELSTTSETKRELQRAGGRKGACIRLHGPDCGCWKTEGPTSRSTSRSKPQGGASSTDGRT